MIDPLAEVIALMRPRAVFSKVISGAGAWAVRYGEFGSPSFCTMLEGQCVLAVAGQEPVTLEAGDFVLMPATPGFTLSGMEQPPAQPVFMAHGSHDPVVPEGFGARSRDLLKALGMNVDWHGYPMQHNVCAEEIRDLGDWMDRRFQAG